MALAIGVISSILLMDQIYKFIPFLQTSGIDFRSVVLMIVYSMPTILMIATPIGVMIAVYVGIYRISSDSELIAMRAAGFSLKLIFAPVLFLSVSVSVFVMVQAFWLSPLGAYNLDRLKFAILKKQTRINLMEGKINNFFDDKLIYVSKMEGDQLTGVFVSDWDLSDGMSYIEAKSGLLRFDEQEKTIDLMLHNGKIHSSDSFREYSIASFKQLNYSLKPPPRNLSSLPQRFRRKGEKLERTDVVLTIEELNRKMEEETPNSIDYFRLLDEYHSRIATFLSCISFALFALPMGMIDPRNPKTARFLYMLGMVVVYFSLFSRFRLLLSEGKIHPAVLYTPLILAVLAGLFSYFKINYDLGSVKELISIERKKRKPEKNPHDSPPGEK